MRNDLENIFTNMPNYVYWKDKKFRYLGCNDNVLTILGLTRDQCVGKTDHDLGFIKEQVDKSRKIDKEIIATGFPKLNIEEMLTLPDGKNYWFLTNKMPLFDEDKKVIGLIGISVDITKYKETEQKLQSDLRMQVYDPSESTNEMIDQISSHHLSVIDQLLNLRNYYEKIIDEMPCFVFWKDRNFKYLGCNKGIAKQLGLKSTRDIVGKTEYDFGWNADLINKYRKDDELILKTKCPLLNIEDVVVDNNRKEIHYLVNKIPLLDDNGEVMGIVGISVDITQRKLMERKLKIAKNKAVKANKAKSEFIENMSHDIKTPLSGIIGLAEILSSGLSNKVFKGHADRIKKSALKMLDLFNEIVNLLSKDIIEKSEKTVFSMHGIVNDLIDFINPSIQNKKIRFKLFFDKKINKPFFAQHFHIYRIVLNLVSNAIKFTPENGQVSLTINLLEKDKETQNLEILVSDTGIGIPKESFQEIFDRYTRLTAANSSQYKGSGLGLYIVKRMIDEIGASISVDSEVQKGSTFRVVLPLTLAKDKQVQLAHKKIHILDGDEVKPLTQYRVLLVEDNPITIKIAKTLFKSKGCQMDVAETGQQALGLFAKYNYQLVLMDFGLPDMIGYEVTEKLRQYEKNEDKESAFIVGLTAHTQQSGIDRGIAVGMNQVLTKPITIQLINQILKQLNENRILVTESLKQAPTLISYTHLPIIDLELGAKILNQKTTAKAKKLIAELVAMSPQDLKDLKKYFEQRDYQKLSDKAHYIKGGASYCGTPRLKLAASELEKSIELSAELDIIHKAYKKLCSEIRKLVNAYGKLVA